MTEIEILVDLYTDIEIAKKKLADFHFQGSKRTIDRYFYDPLRLNLKLNDNNKLLECCRVRTKGGQNYITYKVDIYDNEIWKYSEEHETKFDDLDTMLKILNKLGLKPLIKIDNLKHIYSTDNYEIVLEEVDGLGYFLEVEYSSSVNNDSVEEIKAQIFQFILTLGLDIGEELNSGKPELLLLKNLDISHLSLN
ncbi:MAG: class IV adenylate cyclase [Bacteroidetes bacterium]|nr:class IV adenylate cyclase [Bacteroidota bacterium]MBK9672760.1 class IV adenylate cyclase [Bacteroidota bacterium]MBK9800874.1 class IV adenylate cyclase [Bacteroidota bacterium]MBP6412019.1 class IV adenylate cyclase [Bacteroidia bacterium]